MDMEVAMRTDPTAVLSDEHRQIERALRVLAAMAEHMAPLMAADCRTIVTFLERYADALHHFKEERILFPALEELGFSRHAGPIAVMLAEHTEGRALVGALAEACDGAHVDESRFRTAARAFVSLLHGHIAKEDGILFPMANGGLSDGAAREVGDAMLRYNETVVAETRAQLDHLAALIDRYCPGT
jgi:hemerythrin-like domain-containing protein